MTEHLEFKGHWFLPTSKDKRVNGILTYNPNEGGSLELFGNLDGRLVTPIGNEDVIQGITSDSKQITLYRCFATKIGGLRLVVGEEIGIPSNIYTVNYILEGVHIDTVDEIKFQEIASEIHNLDEWVGVSGFTPSAGEFESFKKREINIHYKLPEPIKFPINSNLNGQFNFIVNTPGLSRYQKEASIRQRVEISLTSKLEYPIEDLLKYLFGFQNFLVLALYHRTFPKTITLYSEKFFKDYGDDKIVRREIKLYFKTSNKAKSEKPNLDLEMLFAYGHIQNEFPAIIRNWFEKYDLIEPAFNLLFEQFYNNERFSENTFLNLAQAAETYHARTHNHAKMPKSEFKEMKEEIYLLTPNQYHGWLEDQFSFGNNLNLQTRLTEIVSICANEVLDKIIGDKDLFVKQVKWSRNYYTHYSSSGANQALKGNKLFYLTEKLKIVLVCTFLIEVGFDKKKLEHLLEANKHRFFNHLVSW